MTPSRLFFVLLLTAVTQLARADAPASIAPDLWVLSPDWAGRLPPQGSVNAPEAVGEALTPGQGLALALVAQGADRAALLKNRTLDIRIESAGRTAEFRGLAPESVRPIKAEGADLALLALDAGGVSEADRAKVARGTTLVSFAIFHPPWTAPDAAQPAVVTITCSTPGGPDLQPVHLVIRPWSDWAKQEDPDKDTLGAALRGYHDNFPPGLLLSMLRGAIKQGALASPAVQTYFIFAFKAQPGAQKAAFDLLPTLDPRTQAIVLLVLRRGGADISGHLEPLSAQARNALSAIEPLENPARLPAFKDPVSVPAVSGIGPALDQCWGAWMATGDSQYLRAIVDELGGAADYPALQAWEQAKGGAKGLNASVARGLAYQVAGWSLTSFQRTDPHVSDWLLYWEKDPSVPQAVRDQIAALPTNPAFRRP